MDCRAGLVLWLLLGSWVGAGTDSCFLDAHVHLNNVTRQLELMRSADIRQAVVFWGRDSDNESVLAAAGAHPDRFIPFASVSPEREAYRILWERSDPRLLDLLEQALATGVYRGIGEISVCHFPQGSFPETDFSPTCPSMRGIMRLAQKYAVPVSIHCEVTRLSEFTALLSEFDQVPVIWAHGGYTPCYLARRLLERHPNLTYELSARTWRTHPRSPEYTLFRTDTEIWPQWRELIEACPTRFLVGTDGTQHSVEGDLEKARSVERFLAQLSPPTRERVAWANLRQLLR